MKRRAYLRTMVIILLVCNSVTGIAFAQAEVNSEKKATGKTSSKVQRASKKVEIGLTENNRDTLAQGYFDLGESYYLKGDLEKSEGYYQKSKTLYETIKDPEGIARSSRALAKVQEDLHKNKEAVANYTVAQQNNLKTGDITGNTVNANDISRLTRPDSVNVQERLLRDNISIGLKKKDTQDIVSNFSKMAGINLRNNNTKLAVGNYFNAFKFSQNTPEKALWYNQRIADVYLKDNNFGKAIETKKEAFQQSYVQNSTQLFT
jgi:tetratricopeptide (TPR) repeat protein